MMKLTARKVPYSSIVGASIMLLDEAGRSVGQLAILNVGGKDPDERKANAEAIAEAVVGAFEARAKGEGVIA